MQTKMWFCVTFLLIGFASADDKPSDYNVTMTYIKSDESGKNVTFSATLTKNLAFPNHETFVCSWKDDANPQNFANIPWGGDHCNWTVLYTPEQLKNKMKFLVEVDVLNMMNISIVKNALTYEVKEKETNNAKIIVFSWGLFIFPFFLAFLK